MAPVRASCDLLSRHSVEGAETTEQFDFSVAAGCDTIQGVLISAPIDRADWPHLELRG
jgi:EAL domain-containing protein (putative c-di-GMP-specific phosphodiesterase class I)